MTGKKNQYTDFVRPNVKLTQEEDLAIDDYVNSLQQKLKRKIYKGDLIKQCVLYCKEKGINPFGD